MQHPLDSSTPSWSCGTPWIHRSNFSNGEMTSKSVIGSLQQFLTAVQEMENVILVPQRLQDLSPSSNEEFSSVLQKNDENNNDNNSTVGLFDVFHVLKDVKTVLETGHKTNVDDSAPLIEQIQALNKILKNMTVVAKDVTHEYKNHFQLLY